MGKDHVAVGAWMNAIPSKPGWVDVAQDCVEGGLRVDENCAGLLGDFTSDGPVLVHACAHGVGAVGFEEERGGEEDVASDGLGLLDEVREGVLVFAGGDVGLGARGLVELAPDVVDADHDGEDLGCGGEGVLVPAGGEVADGMARDAAVEDVDAEFGVRCLKPRPDERDVAVAEAEVRAPRGGLAVGFATCLGDGVADEEEGVVGLEEHGMSQWVFGLARQGKSGVGNNRICS